MRTRLLVITGAAALALLVAAWAAVLTAQGPSGARPGDSVATNPDMAVKTAAERARAQAAVENFTSPRTPWGDPDLGGYWYLATYTPLQRPPELADKPFYTEAEAIETFKRAVEVDADVDPATVHYDWKEYGMEAWQAGATPNLRTALIVDPPDGRMPPLTPEAQQRRAAAAAAARLRDPGAGVQTYGNTYTRCILGIGAAPLVRGGNPGAESAAAAAGVSAESHFVQAPGYMLIVTQSNSDVRIIPIDGRPHLPAGVRQWTGDSRARWEGDTLVVETANQVPHRHFYGVQMLNSVMSDEFRVVERFTRTAPACTQVPVPSLKSSATRPSKTSPFAGSVVSANLRASPIL